MVVTWTPTEFITLTVVRLFKCTLSLGPRAVNMLQTPRYLNPALRCYNILLESVSTAVEVILVVTSREQRKWWLRQI